MKSHTHLSPTSLQVYEDWFVNVLEQPDVDCADNGTPGIQSPPNPTEIACAYFYSLKSMKKVNPTRYLVRLYHLLAKYERNSNLQLPECIVTDSTVTNICGIKDLIAVQQTLDSIATLTTDVGEVNSLKESILYGDSTSRDSLVTLLTNELHSRARFMRAENKSDSLSLVKLAQATDRIVCNDSLVTNWKEVYKIYISYLLSDSLNTTEQQKIDALSRLCSDKYGESVNLARALASTYSKLNYEHLDNCAGNGKALPREITNRDYKYDVLVYPNPTKSDITISFDRDIDASILLKDISGKLLSTTRMQGERSKTVSLAVADGVYFLHTVANSGELLSVNKIVVAR